MRHYDLLPHAQSDIMDLLAYALRYTDEAADRLIDTLTDVFDLLAAFPAMGRARPDLGTGLRSFSIPRVRAVVYYRPSRGTDTVLIVRVLRQERSVTGRDFG